MERFSAEVVSNTRIAEDHFKIEFTVPWQDIPDAGQFVNITCGKGSFLNRPFSIAECSGTTAVIIVKVVGRSSQYLSTLAQGNVVAMLGPLGRGFPTFTESRIVYLGGGCGIPPLLFHASLMPGERNNHNSIIFAGFRNGSEVILEKEFEAYGVDFRVATEDGSRGEQGLVTDILKKYLDSYTGKCIIFACGPVPMLKVASEISKIKSIKCYLCLESYMACGFGVCNGCVQAVRKKDEQTEYVKVCTHGPVFNSENIIWELE